MTGNSAVLPRVSIGLPVYNGENYLRDSLDSLLAQTFTSFELIISDNASTDGTEAICREYAARDTRIRYIRQIRNRGAAANFQFVLDEAACEFFMWAGGDDRWDPTWLATLLPMFAPGVSITFGSSVGFLDDGRLETRMIFKSLGGPRASRMLRYFLWPEAGQKANVIYGLYRTEELRQVVADVFIPGKENRVGFDIILVFSVLRIGCLNVEPRVTLYKRSKLGVARFRSGKLLSWQRVSAFCAYLSKLELVPYLVEHARRAPPGLARAAIWAVLPFKFCFMFCSGLVPGAVLLVRRLKGRRAIEAHT